MNVVKERNMTERDCLSFLLGPLALQVTTECHAWIEVNIEERQD